MSITINGSGTLTGISVGGLPDGIVDTDMLHSSAVTSALLPAGSVVQVAQAVSDSVFHTNNTGFVNTSFFSLSFDNPIQSGSKVLVSIDLTFGEDYSGTWAQPHYFTAYQGTSSDNGSNIGDTNGIGGANAISMASSNAGNWNQYDLQRFSGRALHTPSNTDPYYRLFVRTRSNTRDVHIGENGNQNTQYQVGRTYLTIMEIAG
tara:strand:+ start:114 stop:725 length:612 start_codon:yes stop_codon:yes gene_type:complete